MSKLPDLIIGDLRISPPIIQGGMGINISRANLASAVANEGGVGTISAITGGAAHNPASPLSDAALREQIRKARRQTMGVLAVNILVALTNYADIVKVVTEEGIDIIFSGAGLPMNLPKLVEGTKTKICPIVSSARSAEILCRNWKNKYHRAPDAIVVEGPLAGGHLGYSNEELGNGTPLRQLDDILLEVIAVADRYASAHQKRIPVIAAGGIYDGKDIARVMKLGAAGVQMATRFVCTNECDAADEFKQAYLNATKDDVSLIQSPLGLPGRALRGNFLDRAKKGEVKFTCRYRCIKTCNPASSPYCIADALLNASQGNLKDGFVFVGSNVHRVDKIVSVKELVRELVEEAEKEFSA